MNQSSLSRLKPIISKTQVDRIEKVLEEYFIKGNFQPGDSIPKEIEFAESLGVSRTAIREALSRFKTLGIIESKRRKGMVISNPDIFNNMKRIIDIQLLDGDTIKDIFELRLVLEMGIIDLLFLRKTKAYLNRLKEIVAKEATSSNLSQRLKLDVEFHSTLYEMSGNKTIQHFQETLLPVFDYASNTLHVRTQKENKNFVSHKILLDTLENGTPEEFRIKMKQHLINYFKAIKMIHIDDKD